MGKIPEPETQRDKQLIKDYQLKNKDGSPMYSISGLGVRYARIDHETLIPLTATRIHQILNKHGVKKDRVKILDKSAKKN
jgi:hypothetical protein